MVILVNSVLIGWETETGASTNHIGIWYITCFLIMISLTQIPAFLAVSYYGISCESKIPNKNPGDVFERPRPDVDAWCREGLSLHLCRGDPRPRHCAAVS